MSNKKNTYVVKDPKARDWVRAQYDKNMALGKYADKMTGPFMRGKDMDEIAIQLEKDYYKETYKKKRQEMMAKGFLSLSASGENQASFKDKKPVDFGKRMVGLSPINFLGNSQGRRVLTGA